MESMCRVCMSNSVTLLELFSNHTQSKEAEEPNLVEMIAECVNCAVNPDDPLPKQICLTCVIEAKNAFRFKRKCEQSFKSLWKMVSEDNDQPSINMDIVKVEKEEFLEEASEKPKGITVKSFSLIRNINTSIDSMVSEDDTLVKGFSVRTLLSEPSLTENPSPFKCPHCPKSFRTHLSLQGHIQTHGRMPYKCTDCSEVFSKESQLEEHARQCHSDKRTYKCLECSKSFSTDSNLQLHNRIHSTKRPFVCPHCRRSFQLRAHLEKHLSTHIPLTCPHCPMMFLRRQDLNYHILDHTGERPHKCPHCSKAFKKKQHVEYHILTHMGQRL